MANESVTTVKLVDVGNAIKSLSHAEGVIACATLILDEGPLDGPLWNVSEALQAAAKIISDAYCTLNDSSISFTVQSAEAHA